MKLQHPSVTAVLLVVAKLLCLEMNLCGIDSGCRHKLTAPSQGNKDTRIFLFLNGVQDPIVVPTRPNITFQGVPYNSSWKTVFIVHGFGSQVLRGWPEDMGRVIAEKENHNVFAVDWSNGSAAPNYFAAVSNTRTTANEISRLILYLNKKHNLSLDDVHIIGHSLGAHVAAYASFCSGTVGRITGLDAAQPLFDGTWYKDKILKLDPSDACFVDAIHTNAKPIIGAGYIEPIGDVDFYVNGGAVQPGCSISSVLSQYGSILDILAHPVQVLELMLGCSHTRAPLVYIDALRYNNCTMWGRQDTSRSSFLLLLSMGTPSSNTAGSTNCKLSSCSPMGHDTIKFPARGSFHLNTTAKSPYCISDPKADKKMASAISDYKPRQGIKSLCKEKGIRYS